MATTLVLGSIALYVLLQRNLVDDTDAFLQSKARDLGASIQLTGGPGFYEAWLGRPLDRFVESDVYAQILRNDGTVLDESPDMGEPRVPLDPAAVPAALAGQPILHTVTMRGVRLRVYTTRVSLLQDRSLVLQVARSFDRVEATLDRLRRFLAVGDVLLVLLAGGFGWWMAGSSLRPIVRTTRAVQAIGESQRLDQCVPYDGLDDEIGELVHTFNRMLDRLES